MGNLKKCNTCLKIKSIRDFYLQPKGLLGRTGSCKICRKNYQKKYQSQEEVKLLIREARKNQKSETPEEKRKRYEKFKSKNPNYWKEYYKQNREIRLEGNRRFWRRHPERYECYKIYGRALRNKTIIRAENCMMCGLQTKTLGHHHDYRKPLIVIWICHVCHVAIHRKHKFTKK
jgi:hypothetical protein